MRTLVGFLSERNKNNSTRNTRLYTVMHDSSLIRSPQVLYVLPDTPPCLRE